MNTVRTYHDIESLGLLSRRQRHVVNVLNKVLNAQAEVDIDIRFTRGSIGQQLNQIASMSVVIGCAVASLSRFTQGRLRNLP